MKVPFRTKGWRNPPEKFGAADVLVAGGGMAGVFAAVGARLSGATALIVEPHNVLGGQGTAGGVAGFCGDTRRVNRPFAELVDRGGGGLGVAVAPQVIRAQRVDGNENDVAVGAAVAPLLAAERPRGEERADEQRKRAF